MRVVLYTNDMEPITVLSIPDWAEKVLLERHRLRVPVIANPKAFTAVPTNPTRLLNDFHDVEIWAETFIRNDKPHMLLFTYNEEQALLLKSIFLPGQQKEINDAKQKAFYDGLFHALKMLGNM